MKLIRGALVIGCLCSLPGQALAQAEHRPTISGNASAAAVESRTEFSFAGTLGYRLNEILSLEAEGTLIPSIRTGLESGTLAGESATAASPTGAVSNGGAIVSGSGYDPGQAAILTGNARLDLPTSNPRWTPYVVGGGGIARVRHSGPGFGLFAGPLNETNAVGAAVANSDGGHWYSTDLALTLGGGVDYRMLKHLSAEADLRVIRLLGDSDRNVGRFGAGLRYIF